jgi:hypothetical protein
MSDEKDLVLFILNDLVEHLKSDQFIKVHSRMNINKFDGLLVSGRHVPCIQLSIATATMHVTVLEENVISDIRSSNWRDQAVHQCNGVRKFNLGDPDYKKHITLYIKRCINLLSVVT